MNIGQASEISGVSAKMIRYYESIGLIPAPKRKASGYRDYAPADIHRLAFVRRARAINLSIQEIRELLRLWSDRRIRNREVKLVALEHVAELNQRARYLKELADTLKHLACACEGKHRPQSPIFRSLEGLVPVRGQATLGSKPNRAA